MRGRTPDPAAVKEAKGNPGHRPIGEAPAAEPTPIPDGAPAELSDEARAVWLRLAPELTQIRLLQAPDAPAFARYCEWTVKWRKALDAAEELVVTTDSEHVKNMQRMSKHLHVALLIEKRLVDIEDRFGMNPANRQRIWSMRANAGSGLPGALFGGDDDDADAPKQPGQDRGPIGILVN